MFLVRLTQNPSVDVVNNRFDADQVVWNFILIDPDIELQLG